MIGSREIGGQQRRCLSYSCEMNSSNEGCLSGSELYDPLDLNKNKKAINNSRAIIILSASGKRRDGKKDLPTTGYTYSDHWFYPF